MIAFADTFLNQSKMEKGKKKKKNKDPEPPSKLYVVLEEILERQAREMNELQRIAMHKRLAEQAEKK